MPNNFYRIYLGLGSQLLSQWSGAQSITIYAPEFFALLGTKGQNEKLFATAIFGVVKFVAAIICALFLVDVIGRKRSLGIGIGLQALSMCYIAAFLTAVPQLAEGQKYTNSQTCRDGRYRHDLYFRLRMGNGLVRTLSLNSLFFAPKRVCCISCTPKRSPSSRSAHVCCLRYPKEDNR